MKVFSSERIIVWESIQSATWVGTLISCVLFISGFIAYFFNTLSKYDKHHIFKLFIFITFDKCLCKYIFYNQVKK